MSTENALRDSDVADVDNSVSLGQLLFSVLGVDDNSAARLIAKINRKFTEPPCDRHFILREGRAVVGKTRHIDSFIQRDISNTVSPSLLLDFSCIIRKDTVWHIIGVKPGESTPAACVNHDSGCCFWHDDGGMGMLVFTVGLSENTKRIVMLENEQQYSKRIYCVVTAIYIVLTTTRQSAVIPIFMRWQLDRSAKRRVDSLSHSEITATFKLFRSRYFASVGVDSFSRSERRSSISDRRAIAVCYYCDAKMIIQLFRYRVC